VAIRSECGQFVKHAVVWCLVERVKDGPLSVGRIDKRSAWRFSCCVVGGSRIRSIVKRSTLRAHTPIVIRPNAERGGAMMPIPITSETTPNSSRQRAKLTKLSNAVSC
jgi:hypothetical protein